MPVSGIARNTCHDDSTRLTDGLPPVPRVTDHGDPLLAAEDRLERLCEETVIVCNQNSNRTHVRNPRKRPTKLCLVNVTL